MRMTDKEGKILFTLKVMQSHLTVIELSRLHEMLARSSFLFFDNSVTWSRQNCFESTRVQGVGPPTEAFSNLPGRNLELTPKAQNDE